jgi:DNA-binding MarR family transcriptional regulator
MTADGPDGLTPAQFAALLAVYRLYAAGRPVTVRGVARSLGRWHHGYVARSLRELRRRGLVEWRGGRCGTIVPACTVEVLR